MTNRVSAPGAGWRPPGQFKKAGMNSEVVETLNSMGDQIGRVGAMDFGREGLHTSQGFYRAPQDNNQDRLKVVRLTTKLKPGSQSAPTKAQAFIMETSESGRLTQLSEKIEIINYMGGVYGPVGALVICHELNGLNVVVEGYGKLPLYGRLICDLPAASAGDGVYFDEPIPTTSTLEIWIPDPDHDPIENPRPEYVFTVASYGAYSDILVEGDLTDILCEGSAIILRNGPDARNGAYTLGESPVFDGTNTTITVTEVLDLTDGVAYDEMVVVRPQEMKMSTDIQVVVNRNTKAGAVAGDFVRAIWRNFEYQVELGGGGNSLGNEWIDFRVVAWCPAVPGGTTQAVDVEVIGRSCQSSVAIGDIVRVFDPNLCWLNLPIELLSGLVGRADLAAVDGASFIFCAEFQDLGECYWKIQSLCCREESVY